jgi:hypothetical protein
MGVERNLNRIGLEEKIRNRMQRKDIRKYSFVNRIIPLSNRLPAEILGFSSINQTLFERGLEK